MIRVSQTTTHNLQILRRSGGQTFAHRVEWMGCCSHEARTPGGTPGLVFTAIAGAYRFSGADYLMAAPFKVPEFIPHD